MATLTGKPPRNERLDLLYIHPALGESDFNIPMGLIGLMNSFEGEKLGVMAWELSPELIERTRVVAMDLHWYFPLAFVGEIARMVKAVNPEAAILLGGMTATIFARQILTNYPVDCVILGDAEEVFAPLVEILEAGASPCGLPNVATQLFFPARIVPASRAAYNAVDPLTVDWFPTYRERMFSVQHDFPGEFRESKGVYPFIPILRGCIRDCPECYASPAIQRKIFGRGIMVRSPEAVIGTLRRCEAMSGLNTVHIIGDFFDLLPPEYGEIILGNRYALRLTYDLYNIPDLALIEQMVARFEGVLFVCHLFRDHGRTPCETHRKKLIRLFEAFGGGSCRFLLFVDFTRVDRDAVAREMSRHSYVSLLDSSYWSIPAPRPATPVSVAKQFAQFYRETAAG
jgi:hypothetical protein